MSEIRKKFYDAGTNYAGEPYVENETRQDKAGEAQPWNLSAASTILFFASKLISLSTLFLPKTHSSLILSQIPLPSSPTCAPQTSPPSSSPPPPTSRPLPHFQNRPFPFLLLSLFFICITLPALWPNGPCAQGVQ